MARVSIFGLGYVGAVSAACLARDGHSVIGVDVLEAKVAAINAGQSPIVEPGLAEAIANGVSEGRIRATTDVGEAVEQTDLSFVCVGTPSTEVGSIDLKYVRRVCEEIGNALRSKNGGHVVVIRSTVLPGTTETDAIPFLERSSGKRQGEDFHVCFNPEFLREGTAIEDYYNPPRTVIGELKPGGGDEVAAIYSSVSGPVVRTSVRTAEMVKYADNSFHALKIAYANEIGALCKGMAIDSHEVMDIFVLDTKLNLAPTYLKPGYAFGGSCLPKDLRALIQKGRELNADVPLLRAVVESNERQKQLALQMIRRTGHRKIGILGLSFKADTDDLRESPAVELVETLVGKGYSVAIYDPNVAVEALVGSNKAYIDRELPHLSSLMRGCVEDVLGHAETVVIANRDRRFLDLQQHLRSDQILIDLVRVQKDLSMFDSRYKGIAW